MLTVNNLTKDYGKFRALDHVSFSVPRGAAALLIGPNGAGKTTIVKSVLGLLRYDGQILVDSQNVFNDGGRARSKIGYVPQQLTFGYNTSIEEQACFIANLKRCTREDAATALRQANLWEIRRRKVNSLSHGMRQKLGIAMALLTDPPLLIFDEPINNVDLRGQLEFRSRVQELTKQGKTLLIATHLSGLSEFIAMAIVLHRGRIVAQGTPEELLAKMNAADTLYLRVNEVDAPKVVRLIEEQFAHYNIHDSSSSARGVAQNKEWLVFSLPPGLKAKVLQEVQSAGYEIRDLIIEPSTIESQYVRLLEGVTAH